MRKLPMISMLASAAFALSACSGEPSVSDEYSVDIINATGDKIGTLELETADGGGVEIEVSIAGISPGIHAMHFHETGLCDGPDYKSSGGHYNPTMVSHGQVADGPHAGDMMNINVGADGSGKFEVVNPKVSLRGGDLPALIDADGSALIIHEKADDYESQPSGAAGARIACALIR